MTDGLLAFVLARLDRIPSPVLLHSEAAEFPAPELAALLAAGVLREYVRAEAIRRPTRFPPGRELIVTETPEGLFGCAQPDDYHEPFLLTADDVRQYIVAVSDFLALLQRANDVKGVVMMSGRDLYSLGERALSERQQAIVYASMPNNDIDRFLATCARVKDGFGRRVFVLVPRAFPLSPEQRAALAAMNIRVLALEQHVTPTSWRLPWDDAAAPVASTVGPATPAATLESDVHYVALEGSHRSSKTRDEYAALVTRREEFDMFIDGIAHQAWRRVPEKGLCSKPLRAPELFILRDYIESRHVLRPRATKTGAKCANEGAARKLFTRARSKVDVKLGRNRYRAFKFHQNPNDPTLNAYEFAPPDGFRFCLIVPP